MGKVVDVLKAILTRLIFAGHGFIAIWRVTTIKLDPAYWYLSISLLVLAFEGIFTLTIKANQEWRWFCPSVFLYLSSVVPSIWLLEFDKLDRRLEEREGLNISLSMLNTTEELSSIQTFGGEIKIPLTLSAERWATVIQQLLMLILIIGRWLLPKGDLTRDQLSQLLLVYIGTAADIIEFFDSFKDDKVASNRVLCIIILAIWSWSLLQFTMVLTAGPIKNKKAVRVKDKKHNCCHTAKNVCCSVDVWSILINIILQDAPFFIFRLLLILHYKIISETNIFFTCKNTLVIILQFYRLIVVQAEKRKGLKPKTELAGKSLSQPSNATKKRGASPAGGVDSARNLRGTKIVKVAPSSSIASSRGAKSPKSPKRAVAKLVRTASEDDGAAVYPSPAHSSAFLLHTENDTSWRQYSRGRRRSLSTGDLSVTAELSVEMDSSPDRSTCFSADLGAGCDAEVGDLVESDFEAERLSNLEEEDNDNEEVNEDVESQSSAELEYPRDKETSAFNLDRKRRANSSRYGTVDEVRSITSPKPRASTSQARPIPMPRKGAIPSQPLSRSPTNRSVTSRCSTSQGKDKKRTTRQDTGYSTGSSASARESLGNGKRMASRSMTPNRESRERESRRGAAAARPRDLGRPIPSSTTRGSNLQEHELYELGSPTRVNRSSSKSNRPSRKSNSSSSRRELSVEYDDGGPDSGSLGGEDRTDGFRAEAVSRQT